MTLSSPSIDQGALQQFEDRFFQLLQQRQSRLLNSPAVDMLDPKGKYNFMSRIGTTELAEVSTRNPDKVYADYGLDQRRVRKRRFTKTFTIDALHDVNELLKDPTSDLIEQLVAAWARTADRVLVEAALGDVTIGASDTSGSALSAANDGVLTVTGTGAGGFDYAVVQELVQNAINADMTDEDISKSLVAITGKENTALMASEEFINSDYISGRPVEEGMLRKAGVFGVIKFAGSVSGGATVLNPVLPEGVSTRSCLWLAPSALKVAHVPGQVIVAPNPNKVNSMDITIDGWINAMRTEGPRVQIITTNL